MAAVGALLPYGPAMVPAGFQPAPVVDVGYCAPGQVTLKVKEKRLSFTGDDFTVVDDRGTLWFRMDARMFSMRESKTLSDGAGRPALTLRKKLMSMHNTYEILDARGQLVAAVKQKHLTLSPVLNVHVGPDASGRSGAGDFVAKGNLLAKKFEVLRNVGGREVQVAQVKKESRFSGVSAFLHAVTTEADNYYITAEPGVDLALLVALCIIVDEMKEGEQKH